MQNIQRGRHRQDCGAQTDKGKNFKIQPSDLLVETIADAFDGLDVSGASGMFFYFFPQPADNRHDVAVVVDIFFFPYFLIDPLLGQNFPLVFRKEQQKVKFLWQQFTDSPGCPDGPFAGINIQTVKAEDRFLSPVKAGIAPDQGNDPGDQLIHMKRFGQIIICTGPQAPYFGKAVILCSEHQDWQAAFPADLFQCIKTICPGHHYVQYHKLVFLFAEFLNTGIPNVAAVGFESLRQDASPDQFAQFSVVIYDQDFIHIHICSFLKTLFVAAGNTAVFPEKFFCCVFLYYTHTERHLARKSGTISDSSAVHF